MHVKSYNYWLERIFWEHCDHTTQIFTLASGGGCGKAGKETMPIRTPAGWKLLKDIEVGDTICATDGTNQEVLGVFPQGTRKIYEVTFNDGTKTSCDAEHLWTVFSAKQRDHKSGPQTISTLELQKHIKKDFSIPAYEAVKGIETYFRVHPYLLGVLLGNGCLSSDSITATFGNKETLEESKKYWSETSERFIDRDNCWKVCYLGLVNFVQQTNSQTKYIPKDYLHSSVQQRLDLLQGLMDTDGTCGKEGTASYSTISLQLAKDVCDLARGLGFLVTCSSRIPTYTYRGKKKKGLRCYTIQIRRTHNTKTTQIFRVSYKKERSQQLHKQYYHRKIVSVKYKEKAKAICIKVSNENQLYLTNDYIVTHNTWGAAAVVFLFWIALPYERAAIVTSTELASLKNRIFGYLVTLGKEAVLKPNLIINVSPPPSIRCDPQDFKNGIYGVAAKKGDEDRTIESIKGRHPKDSLMLVLDEATDMPLGITGVIPNLKKSLAGRFQGMALGNSKSWTDLHGALSFPKKGIENLDPKKDFRWETTQPGGVCLYFNPYDSPAIHEKDPIKKAVLGSFLITAEKLIESERDEGVDTDAFWQFTMGFWRSKTHDKTIVSEAFLKDYNPTSRAEFSGKYPLIMLAGLDPAFSIGGDKCILRLAVLGHHVNGKMVIDFQGNKLIFDIKLRAGTGKSAEIQIADEVIEICARYNIPLNTLCIDASGQGRGLADVIQLRSGGGLTPTKIYSTNIGNHSKQEFDTVISSAFEMWTKGREFIANAQIHGMDSVAYAQLHNRLVIDKEGKKSLEKKDVYKKRMAVANSNLARSPDEADAAMLTIQAACIHHGLQPGQTRDIITYGNIDSYKFEMAKKQYEEKLQKKAIFSLTANYSNGIGSLVKKRAF